VRQGDPLGPLLFAVAAHFILEEAAAQGLDSRAYLDDGIFTTPEPFTVTLSLPRMQAFYWIWPPPSSSDSAALT
jgi:hypothetical protein